MSQYIVSFCNLSPASIPLAVIDDALGSVRLVDLKSIPEMRGATGIAYWKERYWIGLVYNERRNALLELDENLGILDVHHLELVGDIHSIETDGTQLLIVSTRHDKVIGFSPENGSREKVIYDCGGWNLDSCHLNSIVVHKGDVYASMFRSNTYASSPSGIIVNLSKNRLIADGLAHPHSILFHDEDMLFCESYTQSVCSIRDKEKLNLLHRPGYLRGLYATGSRALFGISAFRDSSRSTGAEVDFMSSSDNAFRCGVGILDMETRTETQFIDTSNFSSEIYEIRPYHGNLANVLSPLSSLEHRLRIFDRQKLKGYRRDIDFLRLTHRTTNAPLIVKDLTHHVSDTDHAGIIESDSYRKSERLWFNGTAAILMRLGSDEFALDFKIRWQQSNIECSIGQNIFKVFIEGEIIHEVDIGHLESSGEKTLSLRYTPVTQLRYGPIVTFELISEGAEHNIYLEVDEINFIYGDVHISAENKLRSAQESAFNEEIDFWDQELQIKGQDPIREGVIRLGVGDFFQKLIHQDLGDGAIRKKRILEIGISPVCSLLRLIDEKSADVLYVNYYAQSYRKMHHFHNIDVTISGIEIFPEHFKAAISEMKFDIIYFANALHKIPDIKSLVEITKPYLADNGCIVHCHSLTESEEYTVSSSQGRLQISNSEFICQPFQDDQFIVQDFSDYSEDPHWIKGPLSWAVYSLK